MMLATMAKLGITRFDPISLSKLDHAAPPEDTLRRCICPPPRASLKKLLGTDDLADTVLSLYRERFGDIGIFENKIYPWHRGQHTLCARDTFKIFARISGNEAFRPASEGACVMKT
jgi:phosphoglycolate phosphatase